MLLARLKEYFSPNQQYGLRMGRVFGIEIWFHWVLLIIMLLHAIFYMLSWSSYPSPLGYLAVYLITLPSSVLAHELGHAYAAFRLGGAADRLVLLPIGGLRPCDVPASPRAHFWAASAGLITSGGFLLLAAGTCALAGWSLLPGGEASREAFFFPRLLVQSFVLWNTFLVIVNLIPCYPVDGGRLVQSVLWSRLGSYSQASLLTLQISRIVAIVAMIAGVAILFWSFGEPREFAIEHPLANHLVMGLLLAGFLHFYEGRKLQLQLEYGYEEEEQGIFGYDFSQGYTSLAKSLPALESPRPQVERRRRRAKKTVDGGRTEREAEMKRRVDDLLAKIHDGGMESLSREEQRFLQRAAKHFRKTLAPDKK